MKEFIVEIPEEISADIQFKDITAISMKDVISNFLEMHLLDESTKAVDSPIFKGYQKKYAQAKTDFEKAKDAMVTKYIKPEHQKKVTSWNLDYSKSKLTYTIA